MIALHSTKVGDRGALSDGMWTFTCLSFIVTTRTDCPRGIPCFTGAGEVEDNLRAWGEFELKFVCFSCRLYNFAFFFPELLGLMTGPLADTGGEGVDLAARGIFPDPCLKL